MTRITKPITLIVSQDQLHDIIVEQIADELMHQKDLGYTPKHDARHSIQFFLDQAYDYYTQGKPVRALAMLAALHNRQVYLVAMNNAERPPDIAAKTFNPVERGPVSNFIPIDPNNAIPKVFRPGQPIYDGMGNLIQVNAAEEDEDEEIGFDELPKAKVDRDRLSRSQADEAEGDL